MKVIILAAGEGKRLRPLTKNTPKSLVKVWGESLLERQLNQLKQFNIDDVTVVTGYCKEKIEELGVNCVFNKEYDSTNMVYSLACCLPEILETDKENTIILYGDIAYSNAHLTSLINSESYSAMTILGNSDWYELWSSRLDDPLSDAETFIFDDNMKLTEIGARPDSIEQVQAQYMGMIKVDSALLSGLLASYLESATTYKIRNMYLTDLIQQVVDKKEVNVKLVSGSWIEIDTIEDYELYSSKAPLDFGLN